MTEKLAALGEADDDRPLTTGEGNTAVWAEAIRVAFEYRPLEGQQLRVRADEALDALLAECGRLREQLDAARQALDWIEAEPEDPIKVQARARAALGVEGPAE